jgi:hypothetical protein
MLVSFCVVLLVVPPLQGEGRAFLALSAVSAETIYLFAKLSMALALFP